MTEVKEAGWLPQLASPSRLLAQLRHVFRRELRSFAPETRRDVVSYCRDFVIGIGVAECRHRQRADRYLLLISPKHDLRDIGRAGIVLRPTHPSASPSSRQGSARPAVAADAGALKHLFAASIRCAGPSLLRRGRRGGAKPRGQIGCHTVGGTLCADRPPIERMSSGASRLKSRGRRPRPSGSTSLPWPVAWPTERAGDEILITPAADAGRFVRTDVERAASRPVMALPNFLRLSNANARFLGVWHSPQWARASAR